MHLITAALCCTNSQGIDARVRILIRQMDCTDEITVSDQGTLAEEDLALHIEAALSVALLALYENVSVEWIEVGRYTVLG